MKSFLAVSLLFISGLIGHAHAVVLHDQPLANLQGAWCSPCSGEWRTYASFSLEFDSIIQSGTFALVDTTSIRSDLSFAVWDEPFGNMLYSLVVHEGEYDEIPIESDFYWDGSWATVNFPDWDLPAGQYWISMFGANGNLSWGSDMSIGNDRQYYLSGKLNQPARYVGYSLSGRIVPEPSTAVLLILFTICAPRTRSR